MEVLEARSAGDVPDLLRKVREAAELGLTAAGFVAYEAAPAFDPALRVVSGVSTPLAWFGLFRGHRRTVLPEPPTERGAEANGWLPSLSAAEHAAGVAEIRRRIARGDTYQVNYTFRLDAGIDGDPRDFFLRLVRSQRAPFSAYLDTGRWVICSVSPELFFRREGDRIVCRPMKGTAPRGRTTREDEERALWLQGSTKNRAENLMIVDMVRNDLGRIARPGTVRVSELFSLERYDSVHQLTSTVEAETGANLEEVFAALFPCASVTGAPKVKTMEIIAGLESRPRGVYTGAIGYAAPGGRQCFSVAIRTVTLDRPTGRAVYGTGGGVVWDSSAEEEYRECRTKALVLLEPRPRLSLLESLAWRPMGGYFLLRRHLDRLADSARYFGMTIDRSEILTRLRRLALDLPPRVCKVRLVVDAEGGIRLETRELGRRPSRWRVATAAAPVDRSHRYLFHKTTAREVYDRARRERPGFDDVILWNREGEVTESTVANLVARLEGRLVTPPVDCGLLPGTLRGELLDRGVVTESVIRLGDLAAAEELYLINSVRGWIEIDLDRGVDSTE